VVGRRIEDRLIGPVIENRRSSGLGKLIVRLLAQKLTHEDQSIYTNLAHQPLRTLDQVGIVQMKHNPRRGAMNIRRQSDGELRSIMNPHNIPGPQAPQQRAKDRAYHPVMKEPGQAPQRFAPDPIALQGRQQAHSLRGKLPGVIRGRTHHDRLGIVAQNIACPAGDRTAAEFGEWLRLGKQMISDIGHAHSGLYHGTKM
jgi:hypothetical protein